MQDSNLHPVNKESTARYFEEWFYNDSPNHISYQIMLSGEDEQSRKTMGLTNFRGIDLINRNAEFTILIGLPRNAQFTIVNVIIGCCS